MRRARKDQEKAQAARIAVPPVALNDPHLFHSLTPAPASVLASLVARLGLSPANDAAIEQLRVALTHPSWAELRDSNLDNAKANEQLGEVLRESLEASRAAQGLQSNGQLATLGNSLLGLLASEHLHLQYPNLPTRVFKAALSSHVGPGTLVDVAVELGLGAKGVAKWDTNTTVTRTRGDHRPASSKDILAQAMRACVGLIFQNKVSGRSRAQRHRTIESLLTCWINHTHRVSPRQDTSSIHIFCLECRCRLLISALRPTLRRQHPLTH